MKKSDFARIRTMSEYLEPESIKPVFPDVPLDVIRGIISGTIDESDICTETSEHCEKTTDGLRIIERRRYVRNKTVTAVSPGGGHGKSVLMSSLALAAASRSKRPLMAVDFSEFPKMASYMGHSPTIGALNGEFIPTLNDWQTESKIYNGGYVQPLDNLHLVPGAISIDMRRKITDDTCLSLLRYFQSSYELVFYDHDRISENLLRETDCIFIVVTPETASLESLLQLIPILSDLSVVDRCSLVINRGKGSIESFKREVRKLLPADVEIVSLLPEEHELYKNGEHVVMRKPDSPIVNEVNHLVDYLCPEWKGNGKNIKDGGFFRGVKLTKMLRNLNWRR